MSIMVLSMQVSAQHFISIQAEDKQPFAIQVNGTKFSSSKTGTLKIGNLSAGNYNLVITPASKKIQPQSFTCTVDKSDLSYTFANQGKKGWALKSTKTTEVIVSSSTTGGPADAGTTAAQSISSPFAQMLAQVIDDPDLLKATPWVLTSQVEGNEDADRATAMEEAIANDTSTYVPETKGVIKAGERPVKEGTEITFVDFNAYNGDTVHIVIPNIDGSTNKDLPSAQAAAPPVSNSTETVKTDSSATPPPVTKNETAVKDTLETVSTPVIKNTIPKADSTVLVKKPDEPVPAFDTATNKPYVNPFYEKKDKSVKTGKAAADTVKATVQQDNGQKPAVTEAPKTTPVIPEDNAQKTAVTAPADNGSNGISAADNLAKATSKEDCKKMLSDNDEEKLKHKIYLETDHDKILSFTKKALSGKCINTAQVKDLATMFLTDDARYTFFFTVYPFVYDFGNFATLRTYMIDPKYRDMFDAMVK